MKSNVVSIAKCCAPRSVHALFVALTHAPAWCSPSDAGEVEFVADAAARTGRDKHRSRFGDPAVRTFAQILDDFRQSYVLRYSPQCVKPNGWHAVVVQVPR
jgi:hypothetical protein